MHAGRTRVVVGIALVVVLLASVVAWGTSAYLQPSDWQYQALDKLGQEGLLAGHPTGPISAWTDKLSRYEAAALTMRAVEGIGQVYQVKGERLQELAKVNEPLPATQIAQAEAEPTPASPAPGPSLRAEDLLAVQKLVEEFRTELVGMGERLDEVETSLKLMMGVVDELKKSVTSVSNEVKKHKIDGYMQYRFNRDDATKGRENFFIKGARVNVRGPLGPKTSYRLELQFDSRESVSSVDFDKKKTTNGGPGSKAQLRTASIDYRFNDIAFLRAGQVTLPFGYELEESTPDLWTGDRSVLMDRLFPDQRDLGVFTEWRPAVNAPLLDLGVFNGPGINTLDNNERVNVLGRVKVNVVDGSVALSAYNGENGSGPTRVRQDRYGLGTKLALGQSLFMGEIVTGKNRGAKVLGWYAQYGHPILKGHTNLLFAKYDAFDEDRDLSNDEFHRWSLGYWYEFDPATRLTFVWELRDVEQAFSDFLTWNGNAEFLQLQVKF